jgi:hypothetical protein
MAVLHLINLPLGVFVLLTLRKFLNERHDFHRVDGIILALVDCNIASLVIGPLGLSITLLGYVRPDLVPSSPGLL